MFGSCVLNLDLEGPLDELTCAQRRLRAAQLVTIHTAVIAGEWAIAGHRSPPHWLAQRTGEPVATCRATIRLAERLDRLPILADALADARLCEARVRVLADAWSPAAAEEFARDQQLLVELAERLSFHDLRAVVSHWVARADPDRADRNDQDRYDSRRLHLAALGDGMGAIDGLLDPEGLADVQHAIEMLARPATEGETRTPAQRRADALVMMARHATGTHPGLRGVKRRRRPKLHVVASLAELEARCGTGALFSTLDPAPVSLVADAVRRIACDAGIHRLITDGVSNVLDHGRRKRTITDAQFELLALRSGHCDFPGCDVPAAFCDGHHVHHWIDGGPTDADNLELVCPHHHRLVHEGDWKVIAHGHGRFSFHAPDGTIHPGRSPGDGPLGSVNGATPEA